MICHQIVADEERALRKYRVARKSEPYVPDAALADCLFIQIWVVKTSIEEIHRLPEEKLDECVQDHRRGKYNDEIKGLVTRE